jgi:hypothetical protein
MDIPARNLNVRCPELAEINSRHNLPVDDQQHAVADKKIGEKGLPFSPVTTLSILNTTVSMRCRLCTRSTTLVWLAMLVDLPCPKIFDQRLEGDVLVA